MFLRLSGWLLMLPLLAAAQASVEYAGAAGRAAGAAAGVGQKTGKAIGGALQKLGDAVEGTTTKQQSAPATTAPTARKTSAPPGKAPGKAVAPAPKPSYEDPSGIQEGMEVATVLQRFGPPELRFTSGHEAETFSYMRGDLSVDVKFSNGKVAAISKLGGSKPTPVAKF
jgi:hypothetical protein